MEEYLDTFSGEEAVPLFCPLAMADQKETLSLPVSEGPNKSPMDNLSTAEVSIAPDRSHSGSKTKEDSVQNSEATKSQQDQLKSSQKEVSSEVSAHGEATGKTLQTSAALANTANAQGSTSPVPSARWVRFYFTRNGPLPLENMGNTCYMNSVLQALMAFPVMFRDLFDAHKTLKTLDTQNTISSNLTKHVLRFFKHYSRLQPDGFLNDQHCGAINQNLQSIREFVGTKQADFKEKFRQQDACEFLDLIIDNLREEFQAAYKKLQMDPTKCPIVQWLLLRRCESIVCSTGHKTNPPKEEDCAMRIYLPEHDESSSTGVVPAHSLQELILKSISERDNGKCTKEGCDCNTIIQTKLEKLPRAIPVYLARYSGHMKKRTDRVVPDRYIKIPRNLLAESVELPTGHHQGSALKENQKENSTNTKDQDGITYRLQSVIRHSGYHLDKGHYVAFVYSDEAGQWFKCDDEVISVYAFSEVKDSVADSGYCFFYVLESCDVYHQSTKSSNGN